MLRKANQSLMNDCTCMKRELEEHELRMTASEQYSQRCNVELKGVNEEENEDLKKILCQIGTLQ